MGTRPTTDEEHKYLISMEFEYNVQTQQYFRRVGDWYQYLSANAERKTPQLLYWNAAAIVSDGSVIEQALHLVVSHSEHFDSPISCFVTAEVRQWRRPEVS